MEKFICPVCKGNLKLQNNTLVCGNNHCYDLSKYGYVNLMRSQKSSKKRHGDDKTMLAARHDFLEKGYYKPLLDSICDIVKNAAAGYPITVLDVGCGEGYYTANIHGNVENSEFYGIDISKDALIYASKRDKGLSLAVASCSEIPVQDKSCDIVLNIFSPTNTDEYSRVLKPNGILIKAVPLENHLFGLKSAVYDKPYKNKTESTELDKFNTDDFIKIKYSLSFDNSDDILSLFKMTPYYYKTSRTDQSKLENLKSLETEIEFGVLVCKKV
ncbi:MAG: methyltransferase domain-containing protein [Clostridia bacterium]|nr:methyltransferase domain-containing protein [Clostridia bacterium]